MSIEINNINPAGQDPLRGKRNEASQQGTQKAETTSTPSSTAAESTTVSLSNTAQVLGQLETQLKEQPEVDQTKVDQLKAALSDGSYSVNSDTLAQKMLDLE